MARVDEIYQGAANQPLTLVKSFPLLDKFKQLRSQAGQFMNAHLNQLFILKNRLEQCNYNVQDTEMMQVMLGSLPKSFDLFRTSFLLNTGQKTPDGL